MKVDKLISQFLGSGQGLNKVSRLAKGAGFGKGAATGGILGLLVGSKSGRKLTGGTLKYAGLAAAGAMAWKAYQGWQQNQSPDQAQPATAADVQNLDARFSPSQPSANGETFELALMRAMIGAARADGHMDATEQAIIFEQVEKMSLSAAEKALVFDMLSAPSSLNDIAASAVGTEQAAELYLASRLVIDPDQAVERAYLEALAHKLNLPMELVAHLEQQAVQGVEQ